ncbi:carbohydrate sulfotransferase 10-like [Amphiura filiformis]|uniref:carbohydrate sulfotransferase 10-like n=1 Tax=Amphiura filiformis TaxID=82378 RepID=UPI003B223EFA
MVNKIIHRRRCCSLSCYIGLIITLSVLLFAWNLQFTGYKYFTLRPYQFLPEKFTNVPQHTEEAHEVLKPGEGVVKKSSNKISCDEKCQWEQEQSYRKKKVQRHCSAANRTAINWSLWLRDNHHRLRNILVSDKHRILFCYVPKVSCTNWKKLFFILNGAANLKNISKVLTHSQTEKAFWRMSNMPQDSIIERLENYTSFMFVRNPYTRTLSAFKEKFEVRKPTNRYFRFKYADIIHRAVYGKPGYRHNVSFTEFVHYLGDPATSFSHGAEEHWIPMADLCFPCQKQYDYIGKLETLEQDTRFILDSFNISDLLKVVLDRPKHFTNTNVNSLHKYFSKLNKDHKDRLKRRYNDDLRLFGYY